MKALTIVSVNSCERTMRPGLFGATEETMRSLIAQRVIAIIKIDVPARNRVMADPIDCGVAIQSSVLKKRQSVMCDFEVQRMIQLTRNSR